MLKRYGDKALEESVARADELAAQDDYNGAAVWRRITDAVGQLANQFSPLFIKQPKGMHEVTNFPTQVTKVPYKTLPSGTEWNLCLGLFHSNRDDEGFMMP